MNDSQQPSGGTPHSADSARIAVGILGGNGYTGEELLRILAHHPSVEVVFATSRSSAGAPSVLPGLNFVHPEEAPIDQVEVVFLCLPHGEAAQWVVDHPGDHRVIDLTADHRPGSGKEAGWVFGLAEWNEAAIRNAQFVANPGCYPTGVLLSLLPLHEAGVVDTSRLTVVDAASGVTGAGRTPRADLLFGEVFGNYKVYGEGNEHRHLKEIRSLLPERSILFQPHLLPIPRGILETITVPVVEGVGAEEVRTIWKSRYAKEPAVRIFEKGLPDLTGVVGTDLLALGAVDVARIDPPVVTVVAAEDNLGKGAAGQAVQNLNILFGWPKELGLRLTGKR